MITFRDFLGDKFMEDCQCLDDDCEDGFNGWLQQLDTEEWLDLGEAFGISLTKQL